MDPRTREGEKKGPIAEPTMAKLFFPDKEEAYEFGTGPHCTRTMCGKAEGVLW